MNAHWKRPLKITGWVFLAMLLVVVVIGYKITHEKIGARQMEKRAQLLGRGVGLMTGLIVAPFWFIAANRVRKEKLSAQAAGSANKG